MTNKSELTEVPLPRCHCGQPLAEHWRGQECPPVSCDKDWQIECSCPSCTKDKAYLIFFEDAEMKPEIFTGDDAKRCAQLRYEALSVNWDVTLFVAVSGHKIA